MRSLTTVPFLVRGAIVVLVVIMAVVAAGFLPGSSTVHADNLEDRCEVPGVDDDGNPIVITVRVINFGKEPQDAIDTIVVAAACRTAAAGSPKFRSIIGRLFEQRGPGAWVEVKRDSPGVDLGEGRGVPVIDVGDIRRAQGQLTGGTPEDRAAIRRNLILEILAHEFAGLTRLVHDHDFIIPDENDVLREIGKQYQRDTLCKPDGDVNWIVRGGPETVRLDVQGVNAGGSPGGGGGFLCDDPVVVPQLDEWPPISPPIPVGGISVDLGQEQGGLPLEAAQASGSNAGLLAGLIAGISAAAIAMTGAAWYGRRRILR